MAGARRNDRADPEINRGYLRHIAAWSRAAPAPRWATLARRLLGGNEVRALLFPLALLLGMVLLRALRLSLRKDGDRSRSLLHERAVAYVPTLAEQYPMHPYPIVAKALELAYLTEKIPDLHAGQRKVLEVAIGEGTLSARLWPDVEHLTGLDLNPYSLAKAAHLPHVTRAVVGDGLNPPVRPGAFDVLVSLNFLHHVTQKTLVLKNWSHVAGELLFNENTPFWATGQAMPFVLRAMGMRGAGARWANRIAAHCLQHLDDGPSLDRAIAESCRIEERVSFYSERTHFLCSLFSFLMRCHGPPTPALLKRWALGRLRRLVLPMTVQLSERLIAFDARQDRSRDAFVMYSCRSRDAQRDHHPNDLLCPRCQGPIEGPNRCGACGTGYAVRDGMLFLLPPELEHIEREYRSEIAQEIPDEHL